MKINKAIKIIFYLISLTIFLLDSSINSFGKNPCEIVMNNAFNGFMKLSKTKVVPIFDSKIDTKENIIFCSTFQMSWNEICSKYAKSTIEVEHLSECVEKLNALYRQPALLNENMCVVINGFSGKETINKINEATTKKNMFSKFVKKNPHFNNIFSTNEITAFSYLGVNLKLLNEFESVDPLHIINENNNFYAKAIGATKISLNYVLKDKIEVLYYNDKVLDFYSDIISKEPQGSIIKLKINSSSDEILISDIPCSDTLLNSYNKIKNLVSDSSIIKIPQGASLESLSIPKVKFDLINEYSEFKNLYVINRMLKKYPTKCPIKMFMQVLSFAFDEGDTEFYSHTKKTRTAAENNNIFYSINIKLPFMIFLKDKTKEMPYLGVYVANDEIIEKHTIPQSNNYGLIDRDLVLNPILKTYTNGCDKAINIAENQRFINLKSKDGSNTLLLSVKKRNYILSSSLKFFEKHNPKGSIAENNNNSRLSYNSLLIVLLEMGANINEPDNMGNTPLMSAIENEDIDTVKLLIKKGADISIRRIDGKDALTLAEEKNNVEIVNVIKSFKGE